MSYEACSLVRAEWKMQRGDFKEVRFVIMLLDEINIFGGEFEKKTFFAYVVECVWEEGGGGRRKGVNIVCVCDLC